MPASSVPAQGERRFQDFLTAAATGKVFSEQEAEDVFGLIMDGLVGESRIAALLMAMRVRGEQPQELIGAVRAMRARMKAVPNAPAGTIDVCGTGGDGHGTLNVSTAVSFVLAALGVPVAKHGNRALSSLSGASDVLEALGVPLKTDPDTLGADLRDRRLAFLSAPEHHPAMRHAASARKALGIRTLFNFIGPLANPAQVRRQLIGVSSMQWMKPIVDTLEKLGSERIWCVCGEIPGDHPDGTAGTIDEVTLAGPAHVEALENGTRFSFSLTPDMAGLPEAPVSAIAGGGPVQNAAALEALLHGSKGPYRDTVLLNAACALHVAGQGMLLKDNRIVPAALKSLVSSAAHVLDNGAALAVLNATRASTSRPGNGQVS
ncbi:anthranilate phosphoribosyltransferase [Acetobacter oeni]|uniref:Anthranilate phosphoribosyltransferase n=1 Tax=Acetobacter oeni TaxID=304077 RepID=A0A511XIJ1_9PROT|nr:anthranilate phosphoribosyltransferase [Acetobacter oeni]MBB3881476.1 anthranilate phosphoribosyltransferase [Acetobacter oeni]NHO18341.1 anthranilate phosphoribosyltransferase [Acetobacter oeni]GBR10869.1 anthranilate phosphoribosyltransferase [Acetobacter oeni LMG 21952]GEN62754.1 anthranilate phosphoribosyltransferase [Acetobacter oeni]